jgi:hypothetical protein
MNESINLSSMAADSTAALKKLTQDLRELRKLIEVRALKNNARTVTISARDHSAMGHRDHRCR